MDIDAEWVKKVHIQRGFRTIGYHFFIKRDGSIERGRELREIGAHAYGKNAVSVGICLAGGIDEDGNPENNFTSEQMDALNRRVKALLRIFPDADVIGHNEIGNKACPSFDVKEWRKRNVEQYKSE
tara:strand:+ start:2775 stop:3152 length:378 start_codon:yes stop_codon:yes gene_type:complete